jgi:hypothetical protein
MTDSDSALSSQTATNVRGNRHTRTQSHDRHQAAGFTGAPLNNVVLGNPTKKKARGHRAQRTAQRRAHHHAHHGHVERRGITKETTLEDDVAAEGSWTQDEDDVEVNPRSRHVGRVVEVIEIVEDSADQNNDTSGTDTAKNAASAKKTARATTKAAVTAPDMESKTTVHETSKPNQSSKKHSQISASTSTVVSDKTIESQPTEVRITTSTDPKKDDQSSNTTSTHTVASNNAVQGAQNHVEKQPDANVKVVPSVAPTLDKASATSVLASDPVKEKQRRHSVDTTDRTSAAHKQYIHGAPHPTAPASNWITSDGETRQASPTNMYLHATGHSQHIADTSTVTPMRRARTTDYPQRYSTVAVSGKGVLPIGMHTDSAATTLSTTSLVAPVTTAVVATSERSHSSKLPPASGILRAQPGSKTPRTSRPASLRSSSPPAFHEHIASNSTVIDVLAGVNSALESVPTNRENGRGLGRSSSTGDMFSKAHATGWRHANTAITSATSQRVGFTSKFLLPQTTFSPFALHTPSYEETYGAYINGLTNSACHLAAVQEVASEASGSAMSPGGTHPKTSYSRQDVLSGSQYHHKDDPPLSSPYQLYLQQEWERVSQQLWSIRRSGDDPILQSLARVITYRQRQPHTMNQSATDTLKSVAGSGLLSTREEDTRQSKIGSSNRGTPSTSASTTAYRSGAGGGR